MARDAGVDPALVRRFYGDKHGLFLAVPRGALDTRGLAREIAAGGVDGLGPRLVASALRAWESPAGHALVVAVQAAPGTATALAGNVTDVIMAEARRTLEVDETELRLRVGLVEVQMTGLFVGRYVLRAEPLASRPAAELVRTLGPLVQHLLTGPIDPRTRQQALARERSSRERP